MREMRKYRVTLQLDDGVEDIAEILWYDDEGAKNEALDTPYRNTDRTARQLGGVVINLEKQDIYSPVFIRWSSFVHHRV